MKRVGVTISYAAVRIGNRILVRSRYKSRCGDGKHVAVHVMAATRTRNEEHTGPCSAIFMKD